jgi:hypothetical protein
VARQWDNRKFLLSPRPILVVIQHISQTAPLHLAGFCHPAGISPLAEPRQLIGRQIDPEHDGSHLALLGELEEFSGDPHSRRQTRGVEAQASLSSSSWTASHVDCGHPSLRTQRKAWMAERPNGLISARSVIGKAGRSSSVRAQVGRIEAALAASG